MATNAPTNAGEDVEMTELPPAVPPPLPTPPGLELLSGQHYLFVRQQIEILEITAGIETPNRYDVLGGNGFRIYFAHETTGFMGMLQGSNRAFRINIVDAFGRLVMILNRFYNPYRGEMIVTLPDWTILGTITQTNYWAPYFEIRDGSGVQLMMITGPPWGNWITPAQAYFPIMTMAGVQIGSVRKTFAGFAQEVMTDADNFGVEFPPDLDLRWKALMMAAVFLIDFMYFERTPAPRVQAYPHYHHHHYNHGMMFL